MTRWLLVFGSLLWAVPVWAQPEVDPPPAGVDEDATGEPVAEAAADPEPAPEAEPTSEPAPEPVSEPVPEPVTADPAQDAAPSSAPTCAEAAYARAAAAVVRVRAGTQWGAGFVYHSPRHVVTAFSLLGLGRGATVVTQDGTEIGTRLLARDEDYDLAVLELAAPIDGVEPLAPAPETSARRGAPVVALGHPFAEVNRLLGERGEGLLRWSTSTGTVGAANEVGLQADVALAVGHAGAPLLDCEGRVLGMITGAGLVSADLGLVARIGQADVLIAQSGEASDFLGDLQLRLGIGAALIIDEQGRVAGGGYLTLGATLFDRISWMNRVGLFTGGIDDPLGDVLTHSRDLVRVESMLGYRFFVDVGGFFTFYVVPSGGVSVMNERFSERRAAVTPMCTPSDTESCISFQETVSDAWVVRPAASLSILLGGNFEIGYTIEIGFDTDPVQTYHVLRAGFLF